MNNIREKIRKILEEEKTETLSDIDKKSEALEEIQKELFEKRAMLLHSDKTKQEETEIDLSNINYRIEHNGLFTTLYANEKRLGGVVSCKFERKSFKELPTLTVTINAVADVKVVTPRHDCKVKIASLGKYLVDDECENPLLEEPVKN